MIETKTRIISISNGTAWVAPSEESGCGGCGSRSSCAVSGLARYFDRHQKLVPVPCGSNARPGEELTVTISEGELLKAGIMAYLLPAILGLAGTAVATLNGLGDNGAAGGMAAGLIAGLAIARLLTGKPRLRVGHPSNPIAQGETP